MGLAKLYSRALSGIKAELVTVEVHVSGGLPSFSIVGLPDTEVKESRDRVRSAIQNSGFTFPARRITVNLAPADLPKDSGRYDLPIALGVLIASGLITTKVNTDLLEFAGELALDGLLRKINGALAIAYNAKNSARGFILPVQSAAEANLVSGGEVYAASSLSEVVRHLTLENILPKLISNTHVDQSSFYDFDLAEVKGQIAAKKALEVAASGRHSLLMIGAPGCGKSMLAQRFITILPPLNENEALEIASLHSLSNNEFDLNLFGKIPFRQPHHSSSSVAIVGGGANPKPGEISLAHGGVLFLDEMPEFARSVLEVLREPLETKKINIARARRKVEFPADFQLVAAMNPCPCGLLGLIMKNCSCSLEEIKRYRAKISAPLLDRIDLVIELPYLKLEELDDFKSSENSKIVRERVIAARHKQLKRQNKLNYALNVEEIKEYCILDEKAKTLLGQITEKMGLSARSYHRMLKVARTVADTENKDIITASHIAQVVQYKKIYD
jgi:magnesium chelatase family protein